MGVGEEDTSDCGGVVLAMLVILSLFVERSFLPEMWVPSQTQGSSSLTQWLLPRRSSNNTTDQAVPKSVNLPLMLIKQWAARRTPMSLYRMIGGGKRIRFDSI